MVKSFVFISQHVFLVGINGIKKKWPTNHFTGFCYATLRKNSEFKRSVTKMKYDKLKELPVKERPRMLAPDWNIKYFQGRYFFPVLIIAIISIINGILSVLYSKSLFIILFCNIIGIPAVLLTHLSICSGFSSCNTGSYFKATEPIRYWINTGLTLA